MKTDLLLRHLKGLEAYLEQGRTLDARSAIEGMRLVLLSEAIDKDSTTSGPVRHDAEWLKRMLKRVRRRQGKVDDGKSSALIYNFLEEIPCWGWYDIETDALGRTYRWCGGEQEAGLRLAFDDNKHAGLVLALRPFQPKTFNRYSFEMRVNGIPNSFEVLSDDRAAIVELGIIPPGSRPDNTIDITFYLKGVTDTAGTNKRNLDFNLLEIVLLPESL